MEKDEKSFLNTNVEYKHTEKKEWWKCKTISSQNCYQRQVITHIYPVSLSLWWLISNNNSLLYKLYMRTYIIAYNI